MHFLSYLGILVAAAVEGDVVYSGAVVMVYLGRLSPVGVLISGSIGGWAGDQFFFYLARKAMVGSLLEDRVPEKDNSVAHAQACHEVHPCVAFFAGIENRDSHRVCVRGYFANPIFQSELDQCNSVGERHHVCHHNARADFPRSARLEGMVGSDHSRRSYRGLLSVVGASRPRGRTAWRMTWMMRSILH